MLSFFRRGISTRRVAVVLSGAGVADGTEVTEAVSVLIHLSQKGTAYQCFAPSRPQLHVINHLTGEPVEGQERNVLEESARIARGDVKDLGQLRVDDFDGLVIPGGFGAAKNLSSFATKGAEMTVDSDLLEAIEGFYHKQKPIAACCISPIILAKVLGTQSGHPGIELTLGKRRTTEEWPYSGSIEVADNFGNKLVEKDVDDVHTDTQAQIVTSPAYMKGTAKPHEVFEGIGKMINTFLKLIK